MGLTKRKSKKQLTVELEIQEQQIKVLNILIGNLQKEVAKFEVLSNKLDRLNEYFNDLNKTSASKNYVESLITDFENNIRTEIDEKIKDIDNKITDLTKEKINTPDASQIIKEWYFGAEEATNE
jgi:uncharacterized coiled-coil protein SlyX